MKTLFIALTMLVLTLNANAKKQQFNYVITNTDTIFCSKIKVGFINTRCESLDGKKFIISNKDINLLYTNERIIENKPVYINNMNTNRNMMMELVCCKNNIRVYRFEHINPKNDMMEVHFSFFQEEKHLNTIKNTTTSELTAYLNQVAGSKDKLLTEK